MARQTYLVFICGLMLAAANCGGGGTVGDSGALGAQPGIDGAQAGGGTGGGKHDAAASSCVALSPAGAKLSWEDNGTPECAVVVTASHTTNPSQDFLEIVGGTSVGLGLAITVASYTSALGGSYNCKTDAGAASLYVDFVYTGTVAPVTLLDCTVTVTNPGKAGSANAVGTFSATFTSSGGGATSITHGTFDTPVTGV